MSRYESIPRGDSSRGLVNSARLFAALCTRGWRRCSALIRGSQDPSIPPRSLTLIWRPGPGGVGFHAERHSFLPATSWRRRDGWLDSSAPLVTSYSSAAISGSYLARSVRELSLRLAVTLSAIGHDAPRLSSLGQWEAARRPALLTGLETEIEMRSAAWRHPAASVAEVMICSERTHSPRTTAFVPYKAYDR